MEREIIIQALQIHFTGATIQTQTLDGLSLSITANDFLTIVIHGMPDYVQSGIYEILENILIYVAHSEIEVTLLHVAAEFIRKFCEATMIASFN